MKPINAVWHRANPMPKSPTREERVYWHVRHAEACGCRDVPPSLRDEVAERRKAKR